MYNSNPWYDAEIAFRRDKIHDTIARKGRPSRRGRRARRSPNRTTR